jgi:hypothetical protein
VFLVEKEAAVENPNSQFLAVGANALSFVFLDAVNKRYFRVLENELR